MSHDDRRWPVAVAYLLLFLGTGITLPFLPLYLKSIGVSASQLGVLLSVGPLFSIFAPTFWGQVADRTGRPGAVLLALICGAASGFGLLLQAQSFSLALAAMALYALFSTAQSTLLDTLALNAIAKRGGHYGQLRLFGSLGFIVSTVVFGFTQKEAGRAVVMVPLITMGAAAAWAAGALLTRKGLHDAINRPTVQAAVRIARKPEVKRLLIASALHWFACTPYHGTLAIYVKAEHLPTWVTSLSFAGGVVAETVVMATWPRWSTRLAPNKLLAFSFLVSGVRWALMGLYPNGPLFVALSLLHGFTFGTFFVASVSFMAKQAPDGLRATGQALIVASAFGVGGISGYLTTGLVYDALGGGMVFLLAGVFELLPAAFMYFSPHPATDEGLAAGVKSPVGASE